MSELVVALGVGMLEQTIAQRRPDDARYMLRTNVFIPWFSREDR